MKIAIEVDVEIENCDVPVSADALAKMLAYHLHNWSDGRYPFSAEVFQHGLYMTLKHAVEDVVSNAMCQKYGGEMIVSNDGRSQTSKAYLEAAETMQRTAVHVNDDAIKVKAV